MTKTYRPSGSGTVRNRGTDREPRWEAISWTRVDGKRRQISKGGFSRKKEAEAWLREQLERERDGTTVLPSKVTTAEYLDRWLTVAEHGLKPSTAANYRSIIDSRIKPLMGEIRLQELRPDHIAAMLDTLRRPGANRRGKAVKPLSETSLVRTVQVLRTALAAAVRAREITINPADGIIKPKVSTKAKMRVWTAAELSTFLSAASDDRLTPLVHLASHTGLRRAELLGLTWDDIDMADAFVMVTQTRTKVGTEMVAGSTKTDASSRRVDIDAGTVAVLRRWKALQAEDRLRWGPAYVDSGHVFTREDGTPVHADHVAGRFKKLVDAAGVPSIRFHDLRHTHATLMLIAGVHIKVVSERLGHASPGFTLSVYAHVLPGQQAEAAEAFASLIEQAAV